MRTFTIKELVAASGYPERSIRHYVHEGFLPRAEYRGKDTLYGEVHHTALRAITKLRREHGMHRLAPLRAWFAGKTPDEIEAFVTGVAVATPAPAPEPEPVASEPAPEPPRVEAAQGERWVHHPLVPGMILLVRDGAPDVVARLAGEIREKYGLEPPVTPRSHTP